MKNCFQSLVDIFKNENFLFSLLDFEYDHKYLQIQWMNLLKTSLQTFIWL